MTQYALARAPQSFTNPRHTVLVAVVGPVAAKARIVRVAVIDVTKMMRLHECPVWVSDKNVFPAKQKSALGP
jgi:hypothetical protein